MKKRRFFGGMAALAGVTLLFSLPSVAQAQMSSYGGCGHMDSMGYGQTGPSIQPAPQAGWAAQPGGYEYVSYNHVHVKSGRRASGASKHDPHGHSSSTPAKPAAHGRHAIEHVNPTLPSVM